MEFQIQSFCPGEGRFARVKVLLYSLPIKRGNYCSLIVPKILLIKKFTQLVYTFINYVYEEASAPFS